MTLLFALVHALAAGALAAPFELVYSYPVETSLQEPDLRQARDVWPKLFASAKKSIDLEHFYATPEPGEPLDDAIAALERAAKRGVRVRFVLEKKFEKNSEAGIARLKAIPNLELRVIDWSLHQGKGIVHAKFFVVDGKAAYVGSQNFDWRSLKHIHELGLAIEDPYVVGQVRSVFEHDWALAGSSVPARPDNAARPDADRSRPAYLVASPWRFNPLGVGDSEAELLRLISTASSTLSVQLLDYSPLTYGKPRRFYAAIDNALRDASTRGVAIKLLVSHWNTEEPALKHLQSLALLPNIEVRVATIPEARQGPIRFARVIHSKYMVVDGSTLWVGTSNWAGGYLDDSRNLEVVVSDPELAARAEKIHARVWTSAYAEPLDPLKAYPRPRR
jgi:phosphatidylserine/phosphatidylglycerophosphate/cardiolipin synthase-like enzyme